MRGTFEPSNPILRYGVICCFEQLSALRFTQPQRRAKAKPSFAAPDLSCEDVEMEQSQQLRSLDDDPESARIARRQEFLSRYVRAVLLVPFMVALFIALHFFNNSPIGIWLVMTSLIAGMVVLAYTVFLQFALRCPVCGRRFGISSRCRSCGLPRHPESPDVLSLLS